jgi:predicted flavoprotein YhiN
MSKLALSITACTYMVEGRGLYRDEFVTAGGIKLTEVYHILLIKNLLY